MAIEQPDKGFLPIPDGAVSYCSGPTGDCLWLKPEGLTLQRDDTGLAFEPGSVPDLLMGDTGHTFEVSVRPHEVEMLAAAWLKRAVAEYGMDAVQAIIDNDPLNERLDRTVWLMVEADVEDADKRLDRPSWRDRLPAPAGAAG